MRIREGAVVSRDGTNFQCYDDNKSRTTAIMTNGVSKQGTFDQTDSPAQATIPQNEPVIAVVFLLLASATS